MPTLRWKVGALSPILLFGLWALRLVLVHAPQWPQPAQKPISGVFHIHSAKSHDSTTDLNTIVQAAKDLQHAFVVLTDHDAHTQPPRLVDDLLVFEETELSTAFGHLIGLRSRTPSAKAPSLQSNRPRGGFDDGPQPSDLTRALRDIEAVKGFGLWPIVAHPAEQKAPWMASWPQAGAVEVVNAADQLRQSARPWGLGLLPILLASSVRKDALLWAMYSAKNAAIDQFDAHPSPQLHGLCGVDSHGWLSVRHELSSWSVVLMAGVAAPEAPQERAHAWLEALMTGQFYCAAHLGEHLPAFSFDLEPAKGGRPSQIVARIQAGDDRLQQAPAAFDIRLVRDGQTIARQCGTSLVYPEPQPGMYRVEVFANLPKLTWGHQPARVLLGPRMLVGNAF